MPFFFMTTFTYTSILSYIARISIFFIKFNAILCLDGLFEVDSLDWWLKFERSISERLYSDLSNNKSKLNLHSFGVRSKSSITIETPFSAIKLIPLIFKSTGILVSILFKKDTLHFPFSILIFMFSS